jgi:alkaline phosphatase D
MIPNPSLRAHSTRLTLGALLLGCAAALPAREPAKALPQGAAVAEVVADSAVLWSRLDGAGRLKFSLREEGRGRTLTRTLAADSDHDNTAKVRFDGLRPGTEYRYRVAAAGLRGSDQAFVSGRFRTAPPKDAPRPVQFAWGGDIAGQNVCRDRREGFPMFEVLGRERWDFFVALGDMIYADNECQAQGAFGNAQVAGGFGPATDLEGFRKHWRYTRADPAFRAFLAAAPYFPVWDDHEVINDFGPRSDTSAVPPYTAGVHLLPLGLAAFLDYNPVEAGAEPHRLYRSLRWGRHVELFLLDTRQYRDANSARDLPAPPKSMLGQAQLDWLKAGLQASRATWKFIVTSVPITTPTGWPAENGRDGWASGDSATGFERELGSLFAFLKQAGIRNCVWLAADVHFAQGNRLRPFAADPGFAVYEFVSGPMNAGLFPNRVQDLSFRPERLFFFGPEDRNRVAGWEEAKHWFNAGWTRVAADGTLEIGVVNARGETVWRSGSLSPQ